MKDIKVIFLDFDGVLNTEEYQRLLHRQAVPSFDDFGPLFDPETIKNLKKILDAVPGVRIVINSSWKLEGLRTMRELWKTRNLPGKVYGVTPDYVPDLLGIDLDNYENISMLAGKGNEVKQWIERNAPAGCKYAIFDDTPDFLPEQEGNLILISPRVGISEEDADRAIAILNEENR